jgi:hypothetical protein
VIDTRRWHGRGELASINASRMNMAWKRGTSAPCSFDCSEGRDDPSGAGVALGVSSDARNEPTDRQRHTPVPGQDARQAQRGLDGRDVIKEGGSDRVGA